MNTLTNTKAVNVCYFLIQLLFKYQSETKPKAIAIAKAEYVGALKMLDRTGVTNQHTEFGIQLAVADVLSDAGERPGYRPVNNQPQRDFDAAVSVALAEVLGMTDV